MLSKFRLSDHELNIETGRHHNVKRDERYCPFCNDNSIEDEYHILFQCSKYFEERNTLFFKIRHTLHTGKLYNNEKQKVIFSSNDPAVILYVATYIKKCAESDTSTRNSFGEFSNLSLNNVILNSSSWLK